MGLKAYIEILRPINCIFASVTPLIGLFNSTKTEMGSFFAEPSNFIILFGGYFIYFLIAGASNVINDYYDIEIDRINKPNRPLPKGEINLRNALIYYSILISISLILSIITGIFSTNHYLIPIISVFFIFVGYIYGRKGKASGFFGNLMVGFSFSSGIPFGAILIKKIADISWEIWFFFFTSMFLLISRELVKGMEDIDGDAKFGIKTIANVLGPKKAVMMSLLFSVSAIITIAIPYFIISFNIFFLIFLILGIIAILISIIVLLKNYKDKVNLKNSSLLLKTGAYFGLIASITAFL